MTQYNVVAQRQGGSGYLLTQEDLADFDPATGEVIQYEPPKNLVWPPRSLQSYLARGYWYDPEVETVDVPEDVQTAK